MQILSIGNSFSQDAQRYLHGIAHADGYDMTTCNLYIGGCSLSLHHENMVQEKDAYALEINGESTDASISLKAALTERPWDVVTVQQASRLSPDYSTYQPYLDALAHYIRACAPQAKLAVHQTWAYEGGSDLLQNTMGYADHRAMLRDVRKAYYRAADAIKADLVIPSGELFGVLADSGVVPLYRDTYHASLGLGRYALGLLWYTVLTGRSVQGDTFAGVEEGISLEQRRAVQAAVLTVYQNTGRA